MQKRRIRNHALKNIYRHNACDPLYNLSYKFDARYRAQTKTELKKIDVATNRLI